MMSRRILGTLLLGLSLASTSKAAEYKGVSYSIEPIIGYEFQRKENPIRSHLQLTYGARVVAGYKILSGEAEYTIGKSDETFPMSGERIEEKTEKARLGLRSTYGIGSILDWFFRGGAEGQRIHTKRSLSGVVTESDSPAKIYPYAGTGVSIALGTKLSLNTSVIATLKDLNDFNKTEYTTTFGFKISL